MHVTAAILHVTAGTGRGWLLRRSRTATSEITALASNGALDVVTTCWRSCRSRR